MAVRELTIRCGFEVTYAASFPTPALLLLKPRLDGSQWIQSQHFSVEPLIASEECRDHHGNMARRVVFPPGSTTLRHDMLVSVSSVTENAGAIDLPVPVEE